MKKRRKSYASEADSKDDFVSMNDMLSRHSVRWSVLFDHLFTPVMYAVLLLQEEFVTHWLREMFLRKYQPYSFENPVTVEVMCSVLLWMSETRH
jgi:hypothetical protein